MSQEQDWGLTGLNPPLFVEQEAGLCRAGMHCWSFFLLLKFFFTCSPAASVLLLSGFLWTCGCSCWCSWASMSSSAPGMKVNWNHHFSVESTFLTLWPGPDQMTSSVPAPRLCVCVCVWTAVVSAVKNLILKLVVEFLTSFSLTVTDDCVFLRWWAAVVFTWRGWVRGECSVHVGDISAHSFSLTAAVLMRRLQPCGAVRQH